MILKDKNFYRNGKGEVFQVFEDYDELCTTYSLSNEKRDRFSDFYGISRYHKIEYFNKNGMVCSIEPDLRNIIEEIHFPEVGKRYKDKNNRICECLKIVDGLYIFFDEEKKIADTYTQSYVVHLNLKPYVEPREMWVNVYRRQSGNYTGSDLYESEDKAKKCRSLLSYVCTSKVIINEN